MDSNELISSFRRITEALEASFVEVKAAEQQKRIADDRDIELSEKSHALDEREKFLAQKEKDLSEREKYCAAKSADLLVWQEKLLDKAESLKGLAQEQEDFDKRRQEFTKREHEMDDKEDKLKTEVAEFENEHTEWLKRIEADRDIDRKRKEVLDIRQKRIEEKESRLQIQADIE